MPEAARRRTRRALTATLLLLPIAILLAGLAWRGSRAPDHPPQDTAMREAPVAGTPEVGSTARPMSPTVRVTAPEAPLPDGMATLLARAEAGEARAACQLGTWLIACQYSAWYTEANLEGARQREKQAAARGDHAAANAEADFLIKGTYLREHCTDLPPGLKGRAFDFMRTAALGGEPEAIVRYATGQALAEESMASYRFLRLPRFETWRSEAPAMIEALERSGDPQAVLALVDAINERSHLALLLPPDPVKDAAYLLLARRLFAQHPALEGPANRPALTSAQRREAENMATSWHRQRFANQTFQLEDHTAAVAPIYDWGGEDWWPQPSPKTPRCFAPDLGGSE